MSLVDSRPFNMHRRPVPQGAQRPPPQINIQPDRSFQPQPPYDQAQQQRAPPPSHHRPRTTSSSMLPAGDMQQPIGIPQNTSPAQYQAHMNQNAVARRSPSNATTSTTSTNNPNVPMRRNSGASLQRSSSSRSGGQPMSYVALMRKQKATVWSDRAQHEDPRMIQQQRMAKARAAAAVQNASLNTQGSASNSSSMVGGVRSKIRHHGAPKAREYIQTGLPTSGVPMRLSQNEIDENDSDEEQAHTGPGYGMHARTDSGRSSVGSAGRQSMYGMPPQPSVQPQQAVSRNTTLPSGQQERTSPPDGRARYGSPDETPVPDDFRGQDYFARPEAQSTPSGGSGSTERADSFGKVGELPLRVRNPQEEEKVRQIEAELRRRGSVDERTMTMSGYGKLFIANPDA